MTYQPHQSEDATTKPVAGDLGSSTGTAESLATRDVEGILHFLTPQQMAEEIVRLDAVLSGYASMRGLIGEIEQEFVALPDLAAWIRRLQDRLRAAPPDWKGYALLGTGRYAINHTPAPMDPELGAELIISIATEADKAGNRQVGEERDTDPERGPIMPEQMAVRIGFLSAAALDALESQLHHLRRENFPGSLL